MGRTPKIPGLDCLAERLALSPAEAARALGVSERHLRSMSELPRVHLGGRIVFPVEALRAWLLERAEASANRVDRAVEEALDDLK